MRGEQLVIATLLGVVACGDDVAAPVDGGDGSSSSGSDSGSDDDTGDTEGTGEPAGPVLMGFVLETEAEDVGRAHLASVTPEGVELADLDLDIPLSGRLGGTPLVQANASDWFLFAIAAVDLGEPMCFYLANASRPWDATTIELPPQPDRTNGDVGVEATFVGDTHVVSTVAVGEHHEVRFAALGDGGASETRVVGTMLERTSAVPVPNRDAVAFISAEDQNVMLASVHDSGAPTQLSNLEAPFPGATEIAVSADGEHIVFVSNSSTNKFFAQPGAVWGVPTDGSRDPILLTHPAGEDREFGDVIISPDGRAFAFIDRLSTGNGQARGTLGLTNGSEEGDLYQWTAPTLSRYEYGFSADSEFLVSRRIHPDGTAADVLFFPVDSPAEPTPFSDWEGFITLELCGGRAFVLDRFSVDDEWTARLWMFGTEGGEPAREEVGEFSDSGLSMQCTLDGSTLLVEGQTQVSIVDQDGDVETVATGQELGQAALSLARPALGYLDGDALSVRFLDSEEPVQVAEAVDDFGLF